MTRSARENYVARAMPMPKAIPAKSDGVKLGDLSKQDFKLNLGANTPRQKKISPNIQLVEMIKKQDQFLSWLPVLYNSGVLLPEDRQLMEVDSHHLAKANISVCRNWESAVVAVQNVARNLNGESG